MSRPRSPHYAHRMSPRRHEDRGDRSQRFPWDDPNFDPERVLADLDRLPWEDVPEDLKDYLMEEMIHPPEAQRRPARSPGYHRPGPHQLPPEEFHHRSPSPPHEQGYGDPGRHSPKRREGRGDGRRRGGFREDFGRFDERERPPHSPQRLPRERLPSVAQHQADHHRDPSAGWGREEPTRGQGRPRGRGSRERFHDQGRGDGRDRGGGEPLGPFEDRRREDLQRERSPQSVRYEREAQFRERHRSLERNREGFGGGPGERREPWGGFNQREGRGPGPLIVEHDHGMLNSAGPSRREPFEDRRDRGPSRERLHYRAGSSQERFRKSNVREEARGHPIHDALRGPGHEPRRNSPVHHEDRSSPIHHEGRRSPIHHEGRRSPMYHERTSPMGIPPGRDGPMDHRGRGSQGHRGRSSQAHRGRGNSSRGGRMDFGPSRNQPHPQPFPHAPQPHSPQHQRQNVRPREPDWDTDSREEEPGRVQEPHSAPRWEKDRPRGGGRPPLGGRMDPAMPRGRELNPHWNEMRNVNAMAASRAHAVVEETLTIKVDMNRPVGQNSQLCYSSDRQLSLDLVNVGRQRLDFLPMLEHSGTYRENAVHSGTFAQEIITLVHKVKEHYFKGADITLNQRFSGPQEGGLPEEEEEEEEEEVAEEERPTLNRRFNMNMNMNMMLPDIKPLFSNMGHMQPHQRQHSMNDPGDLRHDLERRRQERLEEVKVTIPGGSLSQRPLGLGSERNEEYVSEEEAMPLEEDDGGFSGWSGEQTQGGRWDGHMGQRRGDIFRPNMGAPRRNYRPQNRPGNRRNFNGANW